MISAQLDSVMQEHLIEKYMLLPNQVWDDIISQAAKVLLNLKKIQINYVAVLILQISLLQLFHRTLRF